MICVCLSVSICVCRTHHIWMICDNMIIGNDLRYFRDYRFSIFFCVSSFHCIFCTKALGEPCFADNLQLLSPRSGFFGAELRYEVLKNSCPVESEAKNGKFMARWELCRSRNRFFSRRHLVLYYFPVRLSRCSSAIRIWGWSKTCATKGGPRDLAKYLSSGWSWIRFWIHDSNVFIGSYGFPGME